MAYINQEKCPDCGISIPAQPEDATYDERLCNACYTSKEHTMLKPSDLRREQLEAIGGEIQRRLWQVRADAPNDDTFVWDVDKVWDCPDDMGYIAECLALRNLSPDTDA